MWIYIWVYKTQNLHMVAFPSLHCCKSTLHNLLKIFCRKEGRKEGCKTCCQKWQGKIMQVSVLQEGKQNCLSKLCCFPKQKQLFGISGERKVSPVAKQDPWTSPFLRDEMGQACRALQTALISFASLKSKRARVPIPCSDHFPSSLTWTPNFISICFTCLIFQAWHPTLLS